jgi:ComF family protein
MPSRHRPGPRPLCAQCLARPPSYARCFAPFEYAFPVDGLVQALKYRGQLAVGRVLGSLLASSVLERGLHHQVDVVVPVPLHPLRHAARSFNQSAEIGRWAARRAGLRFLDGAVARCRDTRPQVGLGPVERHANLAEAFTCGNTLRGLRVALVDDVVTTGSTVGEIAGVLLMAGALSVDVWCVARATGPEQVDSRHAAAARTA